MFLLATAALSGLAYANPEVGVAAAVVGAVDIHKRCDCANSLTAVIADIRAKVDVVSANLSASPTRSRITTVFYH